MIQRNVFLWTVSCFVHPFVGVSGFCSTLNSNNNDDEYYDDEYYDDDCDDGSE